MTPAARERTIVKAFDAYEDCYNHLNAVLRESPGWYDTDDAVALRAALDTVHRHMRQMRAKAEDARDA